MKFILTSFLFIAIVVVMYITKPKRTSNGKTYHTVLLRESYREGGKVKNRTLANLTHCKPEEIQAIELALKHKNDLTALGSLQQSVSLQQDLSVGGVYTVHQVAKQLGIVKALGTSPHARLALWQITARVLEQGSRLSAVRLAQTHAACDVIGIKKSFNEDDLYNNLNWLSKHQEKIENTLFKQRYGNTTPQLYLYDVTSSYLEGHSNELAAYGYNRDSKKGKKQIVVGLLCDEMGSPISAEVFTGNTQDPQTLFSQIQKLAKRFGCKRVTLVGDRGMIKEAGIEEIQKAGFHYISAITKPQIETLMKDGILQLEFFDEELFEVETDGVRYILRRNPLRAKEIAASRKDKQRSVEALVRKQNTYLSEHPRARTETAQRKVQEKIDRLRIEKWLRVEVVERTLVLRVDEQALEEMSRLDGCYVIRTDLPKKVADKQIVHDRYKDLADVEWAFRTYKKTHLEIQPIYVRTEESTRGHVLIVMLAYLIVRELRHAWSSFDLTVQEGLQQLSTLCSTKVIVHGQASCHRIPEPREQSKALLDALGITMPKALPHHNVKVVTRKKLPTRRKTA